ncbi:MAG: hypothetical protein Q9220_005768 [cf. Caloplaca sp. 1 TL-2023]
MVVAFETQAPPADLGNRSRLPRPSRPNYHKLHAQPLPLKAYPLPPLIPHNPLSLLQIAFTYLLQFAFPPSSHPRDPLRGYFSPETRSVHITDEKSMRILWEQGFFGKGSLSRSEPAWLEREKIRLGLVVGDTSEEATRRRREERKQVKNERARKERGAIEEKLAEEATAGTQELRHEIGDGSLEDPSLASTDPLLDFNSSNNRISRGSNFLPLTQQSPTSDQNNDLPPDISPATSPSPEPSSSTPPPLLLNQEHLQLTLPEAFFLSYALGALTTHSPTTHATIPSSDLLSLFRTHSTFPPSPPSSLLTSTGDDPFLLSYITYHHFRSLGWVVRPGIKFAVDYLLYNRGPVFSHAEFAVVVLPAYSHGYWAETGERREYVAMKQRKRGSWWWCHCVNRVQAQVRKTLVVCFVEVPPPLEEGDGDGLIGEGGEVRDVGGFLGRYRCREFVVKRWTPNRSRD